MRVEVVGTGTLTAFETAQVLTWTRRKKPFTDLDPFNQMLAVTETAAHMDVLVTQHRLTAQDIDGVRRYSPA